ncbi:hypothetical protein [Dongia sp. agr-C8]
MNQATTNPISQNRRLLIAGVLVVFVIGAFAYYNGFFGTTANELATPPDVDSTSQ